MLYSHRFHAPPLAGAEIALHRAIGKSLVVRRVRIRGLVHDERLLAAPMRADRSRITVLLDGELTAFVGERVHRFQPGGFVASSRLTLPLRAATHLTLEIDWDPGGVGGALRQEVIRGTLSPEALARAGQLSEALTTRPLDESAAVAALVALEGDGLPFAPDRLQPELAHASPEDQRLMDALDDALCRLEQSPDTDDLAGALGCTRRTLTRRLRRLAKHHRMYERAEDWRTERDFYRGLVAMMFLSHPDATTKSVARLLGYRFAEALCHAFRRAGLPSPGRVRSALG